MTNKYVQLSNENKYLSKKGNSKNILSYILSYLILSNPFFAPYQGSTHHHLSIYLFVYLILSALPPHPEGGAQGICAKCPLLIYLWTCAQTMSCHMITLIPSPSQS